MGKKNVTVQMAQAAKQTAKGAWLGALGAIGLAVVANTVAVGVTIATGGAAAPILGFAGAHMAYAAGGVAGAAALGAVYGVGKAWCKWMKPVDASKLSEIEAAHENALRVQEGAELLKQKYESLQVNIRETESHTVTLMNILGMADADAEVAEQDIQTAQAVPQLLKNLSLTQPGFFISWKDRIATLKDSNEELFNTCAKLVKDFTLDPAFLEKAKAAKAAKSAKAV